MTSERSFWIKTWLSLILFLVITFGGAAFLVEWAFDKDMVNAEKECASMNAEPVYTTGTRCICVTPDGRVVG